MSHWYHVCAAWDDDTLAALANVGLLRRAAKDVEADKVKWIEQATDFARLEADGQTVRIDARGPQHARCDCPAPGLCKHILASAVWLRGLAGSTPAINAPSASAAPPTTVDSLTSNDGIATAVSAAAATPGPHATAVSTAAVTAGPDATTTGASPSSLSSTAPSPTTPDARAEILNLDPSRLFKSVGKAATRQAATWFGEIREAQIEARGANLLISSPTLAAPCRYVAGGGFEGMVSEAPASRRGATLLTAIALVWRDAGRDFPWPEDVAATLASALADPDERVLGDDERRFVALVRANLIELFNGGLSHVSSITSQRLRALNMSARGEGLPRLASLLRNLGGIVDLLQARSHLADEREALQGLARVHALCAALEQARGATLAALRGRLRREFSAKADLSLITLGAWWWTTRGGARGLTVSFWDPAGARTLQATLARPDATDVMFDRIGAWSRQSLWPGAGSPEQVCRAGAVDLHTPRLADDDRIAIAGDTRGTLQPALRDDDPRWASIGFDDWSALSDALRAGVGLNGESVDTLLLRPTRLAAPRLDEIRQTLDWPISDHAGRWLALQLRADNRLRQRIEYLDATSRDFDKVRAILVRVDRDEATPVLEPVSLLVADDGVIKVISLDFTPPVKKTAGSLAGRILRMFEAKRETPIIVAQAGIGQRLCAPVLATLETQASTGRPNVGETHRQTLLEQASIARSVGLDVVAQGIARYLDDPSAQHNLRLYYLCATLTELEGADVGVT